MSIQKISTIMPKNNQSKFLKGISFKGFTTQDSKTKRAYIGTSGIMNDISLYKGDVNDINWDVQKVTKGHKEPSTSATNLSQNQADYTYNFNTYHADPHEKITEEIKDNHTFIVEYKDLPEQPTIEEIQEATKTSDLRNIVETMEETVAILEAEDQFADQKVAESKTELEEAKKRYEKAQIDLEIANDEKAETALKLAESKDKLKLAKSTFETAKAREEAEYQAEERRRVLADIQKQIDAINDTAEEQMKQIQKQRQEQLDRLEELRKEIFGEDKE